ncbi:efflux RND transporter periplasmic adaptor subunit [Planctomycetota bacterium]
MVPQTDRQTPNQSDQNSQASVAHPVGKKKRPWIAILLVIAVVGGSTLMAKRMMGQKSDVSTHGGTIAAQRGSLMVTVTEGGSIRAHNSIQYKCEVERRGGEVTILNIVPAGTYITQEDVDNGKILVKLDSSALEDRLIQEEMQLSNEEEGVKSAQGAYDIQVLDNESAIANQQQNLRFALLDLQMYLGAELTAELVRDVNAIVSVSDHVAPVIARALADPNLVKGSQAAEDYKSLADSIVTKQGDLKSAQDTLVGTQELYDANYVSTLELQRDELSVVKATFQEETSHVQLGLFKEYTFPKQAEVYLSNYIEAGRDLQRARALCSSRLAQAQAKLNNAEITFNRQTEQVMELQEQIGFCTMRAKAPGLVIYGSGDSGDAFRAMRGRGGGGGGGIIAEGEAVYEGQTLISMPDTAAMIAEIGVHETEVDKVQSGQPAEIVMDAFPDRVLQGEVIEVAPLPDQQRGFLNPDLKVYKTLVKINGTHDFLKTRMSCKVQILVHRLEDVIRLPIQVVANRRGKKVCYVMTAQGPEERAVSTGAFNDTFAEITEGLQPGDEVLLNPPMFTDGASDTTESDQDRFGGREAQDPTNATSPARRGGGSTEAPSQDRGGNRSGGGGAGGRQFTVTDVMIDPIMARIKTEDPTKAEELETLRKENLEEFKTKLQEYMRSQMRQRGGTRGGAGGEGRGAREGRSGRAGSGDTGDNR